MDEKGALLHLLAAGLLGYAYQWLLLGPSKVPTWAAWTGLGVATVGLYWWATPTVMTDWAANWRYAILGMVQFFLAAKGTGAASASINLAPRADTL